jgi:signal transduction histidine kinase
LLSKIEEAQQQLLQSEKMAAIGQLAAGVAHEINNPVGFVNSNLGTLKTYVGRLMTLLNAYEAVDAGADRGQLEQARKAADLEFLREDLPSLLAESQEGLGRVTKIVHDLKDFSRVDQAETQLANLNAALESTLNVVWNELKYKADVVRELGDIPEVQCVPAQINQVFMNLLVNAAQAIDQHGRITVRSGSENGHVWFEIADTGRECHRKSVAGSSSRSTPPAGRPGDQAGALDFIRHHRQETRRALRSHQYARARHHFPNLAAGQPEP